MKIGFIGLGNMAGAMIGGMLQRGLAAPEDIVGSAKTKTTEARVQKQYGIKIAGSNREAAAQADLLFLAVKPQFYAEVIAEIRDAVRAETVIVSIAPGKTFAWLEEQFAGGQEKNETEKRKFVRCMPNTPALVLEGCTAVCFGTGLLDAEQEQVMTLMGSFGRAYEVPERLMDVVPGVSGSSPAYVFLFIEAMADGAVAEGMPRKQAYEFAAQAVLGSAKMVLETGMHPGELKDMVCSPGGTTIQSVRVLEEGGFRGTVMDAVIACIEKSRQM